MNLFLSKEKIIRKKIIKYLSLTWCKLSPFCNYYIYSLSTLTTHWNRFLNPLDRISSFHIIILSMKRILFPINRKIIRKKNKRGSLSSLSQGIHFLKNTHTTPRVCLSNSDFNDNINCKVVKALKEPNLCKTL